MTLLHFIQFYNLDLSSGIDLKDNWSLCKLNVIRTIDTDADVLSRGCNWSPTSLFDRLHIWGPLSTSTLRIYNRKFYTPKDCRNSSNACSLIIGGIVHTGEVTINGIQIGIVSTTAETYPAIYSIPPKAFLSDGYNDIKIVTYRVDGRSTSGISRGPIAILPTSDAISTVAKIVSANILLPLITAMGLLTLALVAMLVRTNLPPNENRIMLYAFYCFSSAALEISMARFLRETLPANFAYGMHFFLRFLMDWALFNLASGYFELKTMITKAVNIFYVLVLISFAIVSALALASPTFGGMISYPKLVGSGQPLGFGDLSFIYVLASACLPSTLIGILLAIKGLWAGLNKNRDWILPLVLMSIVLPLKVLDMMTFVGAINVMQESYFVRFYPFFIAVSFGHITWGDILKQQRMIEASARVGQLTAQVAHDIRAPIAALEMISNQFATLPNDVREILSNATTRVKEISSNVLQYNKNLVLDSDEKKATYAATNLVEKVASEFITILERRISLRVHLDDATTTNQISVNATEFERMLSNLLSNAQEAIEDMGQITLAVARNGKNIEIKISDTGKGIPHEVLEKLGSFGTTFGKRNGNGLGLFHAKQILEKCNGSLVINSQPELGTEVTIILPAVEKFV